MPTAAILAKACISLSKLINYLISVTFISVPLKVLQLYCTSIHTIKQVDHSDYVTQTNVNIVCLQETNLHRPNKIILPGYICFHKDRNTNRKGRLAYCRVIIPFVIIVGFLSMHRSYNMKNHCCPIAGQSCFVDIFSYKSLNHLFAMKGWAL